MCTHALVDWRRRFAGGGLRRALVIGCLVAGAAVALETLPLQSSWLAHHGHGGAATRGKE